MTQHPYYGTPQDPYAPQGAQQFPPQPYQPAPNGYAPAPQYNPTGYAPQQFPQQGYNQTPPNQYGQPQPPQPRGATGTLDEFYKQPSSGGGKGISWKNKPIPYTYVGVVKREPTDNDLFQDSDPQTKQLKTWRDGSPKMVLPVQIDLIPTDAWQAQEYAEGDAAFYMRGQLRDEVNRAMAEAGDSGVPKKGALVVITLTQRKPGNNIATNITSVTYRPQGTWESDPQNAWIVQALAQRQHAQAPQQAPYQQQAPAQYAAPAQAAPNPQQQYAAPQYGQGAYDPNQAQQQYAAQAPVQGVQAYQQQAAPNPQQYAQPDSQPTVAAPAQQAYAPNPQQAPSQQQLPGMPPQPPVPPQGMPQAGVVQSQLPPEKLALLAQMQGGQQQAPNPQG